MAMTLSDLDYVANKLAFKVIELEALFAMYFPKPSSMKEIQKTTELYALKSFMQQVQIISFEVHAKGSDVQELQAYLQELVPFVEKAEVDLAEMITSI